MPRYPAGDRAHGASSRSRSAGDAVCEPGRPQVSPAPAPAGQPGVRPWGAAPTPAGPRRPGPRVPAQPDGETAAAPLPAATTLAFLLFGGVLPHFSINLPIFTRRPRYLPPITTPGRPQVRRRRSAPLSPGWP